MALPLTRRTFMQLMAGTSATALLAACAPTVGACGRHRGKPWRRADRGDL